MKIIDYDDKLFMLSYINLLKKVLEYYINKFRIHGGEGEVEKIYDIIKEAMK